MFAHIITKEQDAAGVSFRQSRPTAKNMYMVDEIEEDQGIFWMLFDIHHEQVLTVNDLWKCQSALGEGKVISKNLCDKMLYVGQINGCQKLIDIYARHGSRKDIAKLNAVSNALKASSMKALRDFQRRQFETPPALLGTHYNRICIFLGRKIAQLFINSSGTRACTYLGS